MNKIVSLAAYKAEKGIVPANSPYYTSNATKAQILQAIARSRKWFENPRGEIPYAVVIGYEDKRGYVRLLKDQRMYSCKLAYETLAGMATLKTVAVVKKEEM